MVFRRFNLVDFNMHNICTFTTPLLGVPIVLLFIYYFFLMMRILMKRQKKIIFKTKNKSRTHIIAEEFIDVEKNLTRSFGIIHFTFFVLFIFSSDEKSDKGSIRGLKKSKAPFINGALLFPLLIFIFNFLFFYYFYHFYLS